MATPGSKMIVITVDVEALPARQEQDHVNRLIWGRFGACEAGVRQMVDVADANDVQISFFIDFCESDLYGRAFDDVAQFIVASGHDVQLHAHPACLPSSFWSERGLAQGSSSLTSVSPERADALLSFLVDRARTAGQPNPVAFRGGGFRFNRHVLDAMARHGLQLSFNYHAVRHRSLGLGVPPGLFRWSNGIVEVPMTIMEFEGRERSFALSSRNSLDFRDGDRVRRYIDSFFSERPEGGVLVTLLHSWSFLELDPESGHYVYRDEAHREAFQRFLADLPQGVEVVSASELARRVASNEVEIDSVQDLALVDRMLAE